MATTANLAAAEAAVLNAERIHGWRSIEAANARSAYQAAQHELRIATRKAREAYRKAKAEGTLPPVTPPQDIPDIGGEDLNGNSL
jgi:hypothetical protein